MAKLDGYAQWLREDPRMLGISARHWDTDHFCCPKAASTDVLLGRAEHAHCDRSPSKAGKGVQLNAAMVRYGDK